MDIPQSLTACSWKTMVGRLLCYWGWLIFRGYVKLPGSLPQNDGPWKRWLRRWGEHLPTVDFLIFLRHLNPFQYGDDNVKQGEADQMTKHYGTETLPSSCLLLCTSGSLSLSSLLRCLYLLPRLSCHGRQPVRLAVEANVCAGGKPKSRAPFNNWPTVINPHLGSELADCVLLNMVRCGHAPYTPVSRICGRLKGVNHCRPTCRKEEG